MPVLEDLALDNGLGAHPVLRALPLAVSWLFLLFTPSWLRDGAQEVVDV